MQKPRDSSRFFLVPRPTIAPLFAGLSALALSALISACAVGPDYVRPQIDAPVAFKEGGPWKVAEPKSPEISVNWWEIYGDTQLNELVQNANHANQSIQQAEAQFRAARAAAQAARANFFPLVGADVQGTRSRTNTRGIVVANDHVLTLDASWEPDVWGKVRRQVESGNAAAAASAADLAGARLTIQAEVVQDYIQLRVTDVQKDLLTRTTQAYEKSWRLTKSQQAAGVASRADVALALTQWKSAQAQLIDLDVQRSQLEHALAILQGKAPAEFSLAPAALATTLPVIPVGVPSHLLERRPDIAGAERRAAAANANIGVAKAAYYPSLSLTAAGGYNSPDFATWFNAPSRVWSLGATLAATLFDGGARRALSDQAVALYDASVANYKQTVLNGFGEVEDNLAALQVLDQESKVQAEAVAAARDAENVTLSQYRAGTATYLAVVTAQTLSLTNQQNAIKLLGRQLSASVALIKAVGGGWTTAQADAAAPSARAD